MSKPQAEFTIEVQYFKTSGKFYTSESYVGRYQNVSEDVTLRQCYMTEVCDDLRERNRQGKLPGLQSGKWDGFIYVDCEEGFPCLIIMETVRKYLQEGGTICGR